MAARWTPPTTSGPRRPESTAAESTSDLSAVGAYDFGGQLQTAMTAHPKVDPRTGRMHVFGYGFLAPRPTAR